MGEPDVWILREDVLNEPDQRPGGASRSAMDPAPIANAAHDLEEEIDLVRQKRVVGCEVRVGELDEVRVRHERRGSGEVGMDAERLLPFGEAFLQLLLAG